ncbi:acyl-CoA dehydrogenase family protein [Myceligenerans pegani]|uniref:glutaryl-CoA dehydrogenase (ETF) n=1 Tax=Myceligenerans pegani TaxID=2776917 RepID=A0ABR9N116_9MICO|nr:acyl-CoA dehydrogenase family protein [Myceligenerans sp. TRM 65318]MBE1877353.1 acyl-CoA dehydrogenase family protein [Myceligenerans sp. TRM 65318]MBE3019624.1 acyl-CoA dehydrogenase family protein [Myceligenerans sp. TRM 65318]
MTTVVHPSSPADLLDIESEFSAAELEARDRVREFADRRIRPNIARWFADAVFPREIVPELGELGLLGMQLDGYGCAGRSAVEYGLACQELEAGDSGIRTFVSVQGSLVMSAIHKHGSAAQKQEWLPRLARGEAIGCFGLTEPGAGSDPASMTTRARLDGGEWVIDGAKRWIGLASIADVAVIWAKVSDDDAGAVPDGPVSDAGVVPDGGSGESGAGPADIAGRGPVRERVRGFLVPTSSAGFTATPIEPKLSMRASIQCDVALRGVRVPEDAILPENPGLRGPFACLDEARYGIVWGAVGAARDAFEEALAYAGERVQFGVPVASHQLTQEKLVNMALEISKGQLMALRIGRLKDAGRLEAHMISAGKLNNARMAIEVCRTARTVLGGNGVTLDHSPLRHANNLESVRTYEGTDEVHTLILGRHLTGLQAFR